MELLKKHEEREVMKALEVFQQQELQGLFETLKAPTFQAFLLEIYAAFSAEDVEYEVSDYNPFTTKMATVNGELLQYNEYKQQISGAVDAVYIPVIPETMTDNEAIKTKLKAIQERTEQTKSNPRHTRFTELQASIKRIGCGGFGLIQEGKSPDGAVDLWFYNDTHNFEANEYYHIRITENGEMYYADEDGEMMYPNDNSKYANTLRVIELLKEMWKQTNAVDYSLDRTFFLVPDRA